MVRTFEGGKKNDLVTKPSAEREEEGVSTVGFERVHPTDREEHVLAHTVTFRADIDNLQVAAASVHVEITIV